MISDTVLVGNEDHKMFCDQLDDLYDWGIKNWPLFKTAYENPETRMVCGFLLVGVYDRRLAAMKSEDVK